MNPFSRLFCRGYQICFRLALPLLPYRQPELLTAVTDIPSVHDLLYFIPRFRTMTI